MIYKRKLLELSEVDRLRELLSSSGWEDGLVSTTNMDHMSKTNMESLIGGVQRKEANTIIYNGLDRDSSFLRKTAANTTDSPIFSKTSVGGFYRPHQDKIGDYSTTVFLSDPSEYDGGALRLYDGSEFIDYRLDPGWAVTYSTGTPHEVSDVTRGDRIVSIFWTDSSLNMNRDSYLYENLCTLKTLIPNTTPTNLEDAMQDPGFLLDCIFRDIGPLIQKKTK